MAWKGAREPSPLPWVGSREGCGPSLGVGVFEGAGLCPASSWERLRGVLIPFIKIGTAVEPSFRSTWHRRKTRGGMPPLVLNSIGIGSPKRVARRVLDPIEIVIFRFIRKGRIGGVGTEPDARLGIDPAHNFAEAVQAIVADLDTR